MEDSPSHSLRKCPVCNRAPVLVSPNGRVREWELQCKGYQGARFEHQIRVFGFTQEEVSKRWNAGWIKGWVEGTRLGERGGVPPAPVQKAVSPRVPKKETSDTPNLDDDEPL